MTPEARKALKKCGLGKLGLIEIAWVPLCEDLMVSEEELTNIIVRYQPKIKLWVRDRRSGDISYGVRYWLRNNQARLKKMGLEAILDPKKRKQPAYCIKTQTTALVAIICAHISWEVGALELPDLAMERLREGGYKVNPGGKFEIVESVEQKSIPDWKKAKKARFAEIEKRQSEREQSKAAHMPKPLSERDNQLVDRLLELCGDLTSRSKPIVTDKSEPWEPSVVQETESAAKSYFEPWSPGWWRRLIRQQVRVFKILSVKFAIW